MMPMGADEMPPMGNQEEMPLDAPMPDDMNMNPEGDMENQFDTNFDAGVEADEDADPKKYIQQLTGKLSQKLNSYNNDNGQPDTELGKYVLGMLVKQGVKGMDDSDKQDIIQKIKTPENTEEIASEPVQDEEPEMNEIPMESKTFKFTKNQIFESFGLANDEEVETETLEKTDTKITNDTVRGKRTKPFEAPKKFKE